MVGDVRYDRFTAALHQAGESTPADTPTVSGCPGGGANHRIAAGAGERLQLEIFPPTVFARSVPQACNLWLQDWELWALGELIDELVVQNYAYSVRGFERDLDQPALRKARAWKIPTQIGILAGFGKRTTSMADLEAKVRLARQRGHGVIFFYWEGLWGRHVSPQDRESRRRGFRELFSDL